METKKIKTKIKNKFKTKKIILGLILKISPFYLKCVKIKRSGVESKRLKELFTFNPSIASEGLISVFHYIHLPYSAVKFVY